MKRIALLSFVCLILSCDDGNLQIETIDFDSTSIQFCESEPDLTSTVFFKLNDSEALILELQSGILLNEASADSIVSTVPSQSKVIYRLFSDMVDTGYFCDEIPQGTPTVIEEIEAAAGEIWVTTVQNETDTTSYDHTIVLNDITLVNSQGERITNLSISEFGVITTKE
jgi:hypothetical protein